MSACVTLGGRPSAARGRVAGRLVRASRAAASGRAGWLALLTSAASAGRCWPASGVLAASLSVGGCFGPGVGLPPLYYSGNGTVHFDCASVA